MYSGGGIEPEQLDYFCSIKSRGGHTNKEKALTIYNQRMKQKNPAVVEETYQYFASTFSFPPRISHNGMRVAMEMIAQRTPGTKLDKNVDKYVDERLLDGLEREGLFKKISGKS